LLANPLDVKKEVHGNTDSNSRNLQVSTMIDKWKKLKANALFSFLLPPCFSPLHLDLFKLRPPRVGERDIMDFTLLIQSFFILYSLY